MAITHYRFTFLPPLGTIKVDGVPAVLNQWYDKNLVCNFEKGDIYDYGEPYTFCSYQVKNDNAVSNTSIIRFVVPIEEIPPVSSDFDDLINNSQTLNFKDLMPIGNGVDRIKIISFYTYGEILKNGQPVYPNQEIMRTDLINTDYISPVSGGGKPIQRILYQVGNKNGYDVTQYKIDLSLITEADLVLISQEVDENVLVSPNIHIVRAELEIQNSLGSVVSVVFTTVAVPTFVIAICRAILFFL